MAPLPLLPHATPLPAPLGAYLHATLRGQTLVWPAGLSSVETQTFATYLEASGILPLVWDRLRPPDGDRDWPADLRDIVEASALWTAVTAQRQQTEASRVLATLSSAGLRGLVFKGVALAHLIYPNPALRPASDIDLLIEPSALAPIASILGELGYQRETVYLQQVMLVGAANSVWTPILDVHWAVSDAQVIGRVFSFEELWARSIPVTALGPYARTVSAVDALLLACAHFAQNRQWDRFIWLYDIHLLAESLTPEEVDQFIRLAAVKRLRCVCGAALSLAHYYFGADLAAMRLRDLTAPRWWWRVQEPSAHYLAQRHLLLHDFLLQMRGGDWPTRRRLLRRILLAPAGIRRLDTWEPPPWLRPLVAAHRRATTALQRRLDI